MKLNYSRSLKDLSTVLMESNATGPDPAYWNFNEISKEKWENLTILSAGLYGIEYNKTYGHYHSSADPDETYRILLGDTVFLLQKKHIEEGNLISNKIDAFLVVAVKPGQEITIPNIWAHSWINLGNTPLVMVDDWRTPTQPSRYKEISEQQGMAYYMVEEDGKPKLVPNNKYLTHPSPEYLSVEEFAKY